MLHSTQGRIPAQAAVLVAGLEPARAFAQRRAKSPRLPFFATPAPRWLRNLVSLGPVLRGLVKGALVKRCDSQPLQVEALSRILGLSTQYRWKNGAVVSKKIPILVVEDNRLVRDGITAMLAEQRDFKVVAAVDRAPAALEQAREMKPELVLLDAALGDHDTHRLVADIKHATPEVRIIIMDLLPVPEDVLDFVNAGVSGFIAKDATLDDFVSTIRSVASGRDVLPSSLTGTLFSHIAKLAVGRKPSEVLTAVRMTERERAVFDLIADGLSNKEIALRLHLATNTIKGHVHNILEKLALHTRLQIAAYARTSAKLESASPPR